MKLSDKQKAFLKKLTVWLLLLAGGYGIFKTAKAIKAEGGK